MVTEYSLPVFKTIEIYYLKLKTMLYEPQSTLFMYSLQTICIK